jgi:hypothetical protein
VQKLLTHALKLTRSPKKGLPNPPNSTTKRHKFASAIIVIATTILHKCARQRLNVDNAHLKHILLKNISLRTRQSTSILIAKATI